MFVRFANQPVFNRQLTPILSPTHANILLNP